MRNDLIKIILPFVAGVAVAGGSFFIGKHLLGQLFFAKRQSDTNLVSDTTSQLSTPSPFRNALNDIVRSDVEVIPPRTIVTVEALTHPLREAPSQNLSDHPSDQSSSSESSDVQDTPSEDLISLVEPTSPSRERIETPSPPEAAAPELPSSDEQRRYLVRLGVFEDLRNADKLMEELSTMGYHPFKEEDTTATGKKRYRVYAGAFAKRESAERLKEELRDKGIVSVVEEKSQE